MSEAEQSVDGESLDADIVDHTDQEPLDVGTAMASKAQQQESSTTHAHEESDEKDDPEAVDYPTLVTNAAHGLEAGYLTWDDIDIPDSLDVAWDSFEDDVQDKLADLEERHESNASEDEETQTESTPQQTDGVDWAALWEEFGFGSEDANGDIYASKTQLRGAIESSDQGIAGDADSLIKHAVEDGTLHKLKAEGEYGETVERGFAFTEGQA